MAVDGAEGSSAGKTPATAAVPSAIPLLVFPDRTKNAVGGRSGGTGVVVAAAENGLVVATAAALRTVTGYGERCVAAVAKAASEAAAMPPLRGSARRALQKVGQTLAVEGEGSPSCYAAVILIRRMRGVWPVSVGIEGVLVGACYRRVRVPEGGAQPQRKPSKTARVCSALSGRLGRTSAETDRLRVLAGSLPFDSPCTAKA